MPKNLRFWINVTLIAAAHIAIVVGLVRWSNASASKDASAESVIWMNGGAGNGVVSEKKTAAETKSKREEVRLPEVEEDRAFLASAPSEIQLPAKPTPTPTVTPIHTPKPKPKETPKPTPKPKPKPTPSASPARTPSPKKIVLAKASPKASPKRTPEKAEPEEADIDSQKEKIAKAVPVKAEPTEKESKKTVATQNGAGKGTAPGTGSGRAGGSANDAQFSWYGGMLHDRFYSEWAQPTAATSAGGKNSVLVKLRIEKDGQVSSFEIVRPSGNSELDDSVKALANRVSRVEPLPDGLGKADHYDVKINFELNSE